MSGRVHGHRNSNWVAGSVISLAGDPRYGGNRRNGDCRGGIRHGNWGETGPRRRKLRRVSRQGIRADRDLNPWNGHNRTVYALGRRRLNQDQ